VHHRPWTATWLWLLCVGVLASCTAGPPTLALTPGPPAADNVSDGLATFREGGLVFSYPAAWRIFHHAATSSFSSSIADLATIDVPEPCATTHDAVGTTIACADRFRLGPDTIVVHVTANGFPGFNILQKPPGAAALNVDDLPAYLESGRPDDPAVGADQSLLWTLSRPASVDNFFRIQALVRGPNLGVLTGQLRALIASIRYDPPVSRLPTTTGEGDTAIGKALDTLAGSSAAWRCFPAHIGSAVGMISEFPGGPALAVPHRATCRTDVEPTDLELWRATFAVALDDPDPLVGGQFAAQVWIAPDGTPGAMTSGSAVP
jgi:hypothetical protein